MSLRHHFNKEAVIWGVGHRVLASAWMTEGLKLDALQRITFPLSKVAVLVIGILPL